MLEPSRLPRAMAARLSSTANGPGKGPANGPWAGRRIAVTGASGSLGQALLRQLHQRGASLVALSSGKHPIELREASGAPIPLETVAWQCGREEELTAVLAGCDLLILNHGLNVHSDGSPAAVQRSLEVNALSSWRLLELFAAAEAPDRPWPREVWVNTSEAEIQPAFSPLYEISKRLLGELVSLRAPSLARAGVRVRRLVLGPFRSELNPIGIMNADWVAGAVLAQARLGLGLIIVTPNPITYGIMPLVTLMRWLYGRLVLTSSAAGTSLSPDR